MFNKKKVKNEAFSLSFINILGFILIIVSIIGLLFSSKISNYLYGKNNILNINDGSINSEEIDVEVIKKKSWIDYIGFQRKKEIINEKVEKNTVKTKEELKKINDDNKINILLLGRGGIQNDAPDLTDSIILLSINKKNKVISMFSIPRDLYVKYENNRTGKINQIYSSSKNSTGSMEAGVDSLIYNIELLTKEKVDFYVNVDFKGFTSFIDAIGGITINVPETLVDNEFPDNNWGYRTFIIKKGIWDFNGEVALNYARSRHSTSDFDRGLRQQQIIKSIKGKLEEGGFFSKLVKINNTYDVFIKYVETNIGLEDAIEILTEIKGNEFKIISSNLNDSCFQGSPDCKKGGFLYTPKRDLYGGASVLLVNGSYLGNLNDYDNLEKYLELVFNDQFIYKENINISILNSTKVGLLAGNLAFELRKYGINIPFNNKSIASIRNRILEKSIINYTSLVADTRTLEFLKKNFIGFEFKEVEKLKYTIDTEAEIEIIIGNNYEKLKSDFIK